MPVDVARAVLGRARGRVDDLLQAGIDGLCAGGQGGEKGEDGEGAYEHGASKERRPRLRKPAFGGQLAPNWRPPHAACPRHSHRHSAQRRRHPHFRQSRLDRDAVHGRARRRSRSHLRPRPSGGHRRRHGRRLGAGFRQGRLRQPARDGRARQRDGRLGRLQGERDAACRHRRPAGHPPSDE